MTTRKEFVAFQFQNLNGVIYDVKIDWATGVGVARKHGVNVTFDTPRFDEAEVAGTVDGGSLAEWQGATNSQREVEAFYNTSQALSAVLNAVS